MPSAQHVQVRSTPKAARTPTISTSALLVCALLLPSLASTAFAEGVQVRRVEQRLYPGSASKVHVQLPVGTVVVEGSRGRDLELDLRFTCDRADLAVCQSRAQKLRPQIRISGDTFRIRLKGSPRGSLRGISTEMTVRMPKNLDLELDLKAGDATVRDVRGNVEIDSAAGDVDVELARKQLRDVDINVTVGEAKLLVGDSQVKGSGFPRSIRWQGEGDKELEIDVGAGEVEVRLD